MVGMQIRMFLHKLFQPIAQWGAHSVWRPGHDGLKALPSHLSWLSSRVILVLELAFGRPKNSDRKKSNLQIHMRKSVDKIIQVQKYLDMLIWRPILVNLTTLIRGHSYGLVD